MSRPVHVHDHQALVQPFARQRAQGITPTPDQLARGVDALTGELNRQLGELDAKVYGRIALTDLSAAAQQEIARKLSSTAYERDREGMISRLETAESAIIQNADQIALRVSVSEFDRERITRSQTPPETPEEGCLWLDTSREPNLLMRWEEGSWQSVGADRVRSSGITVEGDRVAIATANFQLDILGESGDPIISMHADDAGFDRLYVQQLICPGLMQTRDSDHSLTVGEGGDYPTVADCFDALAHFTDGTVTLTLVSDITENVVLSGLRWARMLTLDLNGHTLCGSLTVRERCAATAVMNGSIVDNRPEPQAHSAVITATRVIGLNLLRLNICGSSRADYGILLDASLAQILLCDVCRLAGAGGSSCSVMVRQAGSCYVNQLRGTGPYGVGVGSGGTVTVLNGPHGTLAEVYNGNGTVHRLNTITYPSDYEAVEPPAAPQTLTFASVGGFTWRSDGFTETDGVFQGAYTPGLFKRGLWFFDHEAMAAALSGRTVVSVSLTCRRFASANGRIAPLTPTFWTHNEAGPTQAPPTLSGSGVTGPAFDRGDRRTVTLPVAYGEALRDGTARGIALFAGEGVADPYVKFEPTGAVLTLTVL